ncbi:hypothetical protein F5Y00DRAFT_270765 [Daldinia vernicosa]|uniref:uncharacterized protein n=1 Tax=Daldinia vernicosa TaxID=114800 RepID=UPI002007C220|nr:uncharacterized protein F5Y00DRAFT_270765 [Daldinia vernicosa]KAI0853602.1 hypothetical protein F5Y00DRAFT_270765 [Daldinia vernicosa]
MHRRNSTKFYHLDRRKSASSAKSVHLEHIRPETAKRDAQAAASQAFARARERSSTTDTVLWPPPRNSDPAKATGSSSIHDRRNSNSPIKRQQSVRFVREDTTRGTRSNTVVGSMTPAFITSTSQGKTNGNNIEPRLASSASAAGMVSAAKGAAGDYINALLTGEEYYTPEDDIASVPSSYRKIRKSRSMFTCSEASIASRGDDQSPSSITINQLPTMSIGSLNRGVGESMPTTKLKAPKSMSFLSGRYDQSMLFSKRRGSVPMGLSSNESVKTRTNTDVATKSQPSVFSRSKSINADKFLRKSMRDGSNDTLPIDGKIPKEGSLRNRARKVSNSFKHKLKSFFNLGKGDTDGAEFPPQQIEASKSHIMSPNSLGYTGYDEFQFEPPSDEAAISRVPSGVPSLHAVPSYQQLRSRQGSVESLRSERRASDERSRVTSWSNSDANTLNTLSSQKNEWDRQRLSVIKENGMHVSSSSARPNASIYGISPDTSVRSSQPPIPPQPISIDSQRIYSALMKRLNDTNKHSRGSGTQRQESVDGFVDTDTIPPRGSSRDHDKPLSISRATIRHVISDEFSDLSSARATGSNSISSGLRLDAKLEESPPHSTGKLNTKRQELSSFTSTIKRNETSGSPSVPHADKLSPQARTLSTRSSAFFASPTCHLFRTRSPYRRALQDSMKAEPQNTQTRSPEFNPWMRSLTNLPIRCPSTCESEVDKKMYYAESVYSCTTDEPLTGPPNNNVSQNILDNSLRHPTTHGDATIFVSPPVYRPPPPPPPPKQRVTSSASSVEWKTWLSANVSKLEGTPGRTDTNVMEYAVPSTHPSGHIREEAQINDEDEHVPLEVYKPTRPDSALAEIENSARASPQTPRHAPKDPSPVYDCGKENEVPERSTILSKSVLRTTPSLASMKSGTHEANASVKKGVFDSNHRKSLRHTPSLNTLAGNSTPTSTRKLVRRQPGYKVHATPTTSPGLGLIVDKSSGKYSGSTNSKRIFGTMALNKTENVSPKDAVEANVDSYGVQGSGIIGPGADAKSESIGSKKIVDLFLSNRRKRIASGEDGGVFS